jgi:hypothetical protein
MLLVLIVACMAASSITAVYFQLAGQPLFSALLWVVFAGLIVAMYFAAKEPHDNIKPQDNWRRY